MPEFEVKEERLAAAYLSQAMQAFFDSSRRTTLFRTMKTSGVDAPKSELVRRMVAASRQTEFARMSILFSTLAAEAYANQFLSEHLTGKDFQAMDRLPFNEKLMLAPQIALGRRLFERGHEPMQSIDRLHRLRRHLVHPKPRRVDVKKGQLFEGPGSSDYNPREAAKALVAVSSAAVRLSEIPEAPSSPDSTAQNLNSSAKEILEIGAEAISIPRQGNRLKRIVRRKKGRSLHLPTIPVTRLTEAPEGTDEGDGA